MVIGSNIISRNSTSCRTSTSSSGSGSSTSSIPIALVGSSSRW